MEACVNSRPLCLLTDDPDSLNVLTLVHFLTGSWPIFIVPGAVDVRWPDKSGHSQNSIQGPNTMAHYEDFIVTSEARTK